jgi:hypothetical protein
VSVWGFYGGGGEEDGRVSECVRVREL